MSDHDARIKEINERNQAKYEADAAEAWEKVQAFYKTVTQREWLLVCRQLDYSREQIGDDQGLTLLAMAWITGKREKGGESWERLLEMTDDELLIETGQPVAPDPITTLPEPEVGDQPEVPQNSESLVTGS